MRCTRYLHTAFSCTISLACITILTPPLSHPWIMLKFDPCWPMDLIQFDLCSKPSFIFFSTFYFYFILVYNTVLVLPYIDMNPPRVSTLVLTSEGNETQSHQITCPKSYSLEVLQLSSNLSMSCSWIPHFLYFVMQKLHLRISVRTPSHCCEVVSHSFDLHFSSN